MVPELIINTNRSRMTRSSNAQGHPPLTFVDTSHVRVGSNTLLYFAGSNYLGLGHDPRVLEAMRRATATGMSQPGASRTTTGAHSSYDLAESSLAAFFRQPAAVLVPCGYLAPWAAVQALRPLITHVFLDYQAHACVSDAAVLARMPIVTFRNGDAADLAKRLRALPSNARPLVLTDGTYGTRGGIAPLPDYLALLPKRGWLLVDDAHGAGTVGPVGRGAVAHFGLRDKRIVQTISLAKAFGVGGGAVLGTLSFIEAVKREAAAFIGSTSMPLVVPGGVMASLKILTAEPDRILRLQESARKLHSLLPTHAELSNDPRTPVTALLPANARRKATMQRALLKAGIFPSFIHYLRGPADGFFRLAISSAHTSAEVETLAGAIRSVLSPRTLSKAKLVVGLLLTIVGLITQQAPAATHPNIVILYADDMGYGDLGANNPASKIPTPNLDRLAAEGMRFTDAHSSSGVCTPSRYALLTGRFHWRKFHGIVNSFGPPVLDPTELTLAEMLKEHGYRTACIGKWHLGWNWSDIYKPGGLPPASNEKGQAPLKAEAFDWSKPVSGGPLSHGFDYYFGDDIPNFPPYAWFENDRVITTPSESLTIKQNTLEGNWEARPGPMTPGWDFYAVGPRITEKAVEWIGRQRGVTKPFLLYAPFNSPHAPIVPVNAFKGKTEAGGYGDFMMQTDAEVGRILRALDDNGFRDNTLVVFSADNGAEQYAYNRLRKTKHRSSGVLRGLKRDLYEGGHRVPFLVL